MNKIAVIGGGASGIMAALTAAEDKNNRVLLIERQQRIGRKLLATGNGRCNLTNTGAGLTNYHGKHPEFVLPALEKFPPAAALEFFHGLGLLTVTEDGGRVYPLSNSANSVLDVLRFALEKRGVELMTACPVRELRREKKGYTIITDEGGIYADKLIVACGGAAGGKLGGVMDGYKLLAPLGHQRTALHPALVQLTTEADYPRALKGVRADGRIWLTARGRTLAESAGEIQFTEKGVSGIAAFDISRAAAFCAEGGQVHLDFMRGYSSGDVLEMLRRRREQLPELLAEELFTGMLHNRLGRMIVKYAGLDRAAALGGLSDKDLRAAAESCKDFALKLRGTEGFDAAQVTAGGLMTGDFDPQTLESRICPGLFVCGELLDIDGDCGGYNLQWAWASGRLAGRLGR